MAGGKSYLVDLTPAQSPRYPEPARAGDMAKGGGGGFQAARVWKIAVGFWTSRELPWDPKNCPTRLAGLIALCCASSPDICLTSRDSSDAWSAGVCTEDRDSQSHLIACALVLAAYR